ncbi:5'-methylthioadenosine/S-adenosylhomocysteine nucleosidase [Streptomyces sp. NPDC056909]|uniref:5'-methylthioadenosine/S-adenosylhomocysteine nucleosidase n=1 Tax=Streptomyces sp. NPDC056909 TaxID=3345963 RepID=UPI003696D27B
MMNDAPVPDPTRDLVVVLTALGLEYTAVRAHLTGLRTLSQDGTLFEIGTLRGTGQRVALAETGPGNRPAAVLTERARNRLAPQAVLFVGVAGALKADMAVGDVVVATKVYAYEGAKHTPQGPVVRPASWAASPRLLHTAQHVLREGNWTSRIHRDIRHGLGWQHPQVHFKPIASGESVLDSASGELRGRLEQTYSDATAIEMESAGMAEAAHLGGIEALTIRGISDRADGRKAVADRHGAQPVAAAHAAALAMVTIAALGVGVTEQRGERAVPAHEGSPSESSGRAVQLNTATYSATINAVQHGSFHMNASPHDSGHGGAAR